MSDMTRGLGRPKREHPIPKSEPTNMPWSKAVAGNAQWCSACYRKGKQVSLATGLHQYEKGFWKEVRKRIVEHYRLEHPEYKITRLSEGPK